MATKKYIVRDGFVTTLALAKNDGSTYEKRYEGGEEVTLDDAQAALHRHKLEFADQADRDAEMQAEHDKAVATAKSQATPELIKQLAEALGLQIAASKAKA